jgi:hypothetical protein
VREIGGWRATRSPPAPAPAVRTAGQHVVYEVHGARRPHSSRCPPVRDLTQWHALQEWIALGPREATVPFAPAHRRSTRPSWSRYSRTRHIVLAIRRDASVDFSEDALFTSEGIPPLWSKNTTRRATALGGARET